MRNEITGEDLLKEIFQKALSSALEYQPIDSGETVSYIKDEILCGFVSADNLFRIQNADRKPLDDIADMLLEGDIFLNATGLNREIQVHKHIGDYTLFMLGMFPKFVARKRGKEFLLGKIVVPNASLADQYLLQGRRSYGIVAELKQAKIFTELAGNFKEYLHLLELVKIYLDSLRNNRWFEAGDIIIES